LDVLAYRTPRQTTMPRPSFLTSGAAATRVLSELAEQLAAMNDAQLDALATAITAERRRRAFVAGSRPADGELTDEQIEAMTPAQMDAYIAGEAVSA
jgi:hypothetical protein